jgi:hypothetical protein
MSKSKIVKYKENPFLENFSVTTKGKRITVNALGSDDQNILVNQSTGEMKGTHVMAYKEVDDDEFIKLFTANVALTFDLNMSGHKVFNMLCRVMQKEAIKKDQVYIDDNVREDFVNEFNVKFASATLYRGLENLISRKILAKSQRTNIYFINPSMVFNGDRLAFTTVIERKRKSKKRDDLTPDLFTGKTDPQALESPEDIE